MSGGGLDPTTAVSISVLVIILAAVWKLSSQLSRIEEKLEATAHGLRDLSGLPLAVGKLEARIEALEGDFRDLWDEVHASNRRREEHR